MHEGEGVRGRGPGGIRRALASGHNPAVGTTLRTFCLTLLLCASQGLLLRCSRLERDLRILIWRGGMLQALRFDRAADLQ